MVLQAVPFGSDSQHGLQQDPASQSACPFPLATSSGANSGARAWASSTRPKTSASVAISAVASRLLAKCVASTSYQHGHEADDGHQKREPRRLLSDGDRLGDGYTRHARTRVGLPALSEGIDKTAGAGHQRQQEHSRLRAREAGTQPPARSAPRIPTNT